MFALAMPAYNAASTLGEAVESVLVQTFESWELVIVDDGSTDCTPSIAEAYAAGDPRIRVIHQANAGCGPARSVAIDNSIGPYIVHFDADDALLPGCLETYAGFISDHPTRDIYSCDAEMFGPHGSLGRYYSDVRFQAKPEFTLEDLLEQCVILNPASVISRALYERIGGIRPHIYTEDYDMWLRALAYGGRHIMVPEVLVRYRLGPSQASASALQVFDGATESLAYLAASGELDGRLTHLAAASARRYALLARRHRLEARLCRGDLWHARRDFLQVRRAYPNAAKYAVATPLVMASPRLYAAILRWRGRAT